ncbi:hypothetical protein GUITHDRAFT_115687 [Guillardia theta CCMP2712]|uniref:Uncharacterized protein n=1 Tax=Guillardia theta (strain CCMP2712) TaxID=905079 RepID=L1IQH2_GUITC|nr:hypothetical protein GUITHDRAFT_115687 [Guillardia theta CCMP2712]EKX38134.1 hypothetical protein GUITHDRAFT_115687 [Guillardia theta CCMP2712]|eukprot:XP_005825114.1 hypothetical protein GUITHDRAFT_115687 [Guillardia theta CCMP2712]
MGNMVKPKKSYAMPYCCGGDEDTGFRVIPNMRLGTNREIEPDTAFAEIAKKLNIIHYDEPLPLLLLLSTFASDNTDMLSSPQGPHVWLLNACKQLSPFGSCVGILDIYGNAVSMYKNSLSSVVDKIRVHGYIAKNRAIGIYCSREVISREALSPMNVRSIYGCDLFVESVNGLLIAPHERLLLVFQRVYHFVKVFRACPGPGLETAPASQPVS